MLLKEEKLTVEQSNIVKELVKRLKNTKDGNKKLGNTYAWSITAGTTCPGKTKFCSGVKKKGGKSRFCYAMNMQNRRPNIKASWDRNYKIAKRKDFGILFSHALSKLPEGIFRVHVSGDFFSTRYAKDIKDAFNENQHLKPFAFTRSWRIPEIKIVLEEGGVPPWLMASKDLQTGEPPEGWRVAEIANIDIHAIHNKTAPKILLLCAEQLDTSYPCSSCGRCGLFKLNKNKELVQLAPKAKEYGVVFAKH